MPVDVNKFRCSILADLAHHEATISGQWPENLSGHVFIVGPYQRIQSDRHLFAGEGVAIRWDLKPQDGKIKFHNKKLDTWDSFWRAVFPIFNLLKGFLPAVISPLGVSEIANTAILKIVTEDNQRIILTADAGRYWEIDPESLDTITPIGYFDQHIIAIPLLFFPLIENTAHPFYDQEIQKVITSELKIKLDFTDLFKIFKDINSDVYITLWDTKEEIQHWKLNGVSYDGSPHTTIVTKDYVMIPDMPFQMGVGKLIGLDTSAPKAYPKTQLYAVKRQDLTPNKEHIPSKLITFPGDSYHFLTNYYPIDGQTTCVAIQQATLSLTDTIEPDDIMHFSGEAYTTNDKLDGKYVGIPWMLGFDPGVLRKVVIKDDQVLSEQAFIHPGWFSTTLYTADPRECSTQTGYSTIYQVYAGYVRDLICRRQYMDFRDHPNRILTDKELPQYDLPSVLAKVPLDANWQDLTQKIQAQKDQNPDIPVYDLGQEWLDFYVYPEGYFLDSIQFVPQDQGYLFTTVLTPEKQQDEIWLFDTNNLSEGPIAKLHLPVGVRFGFTLHSEYLEKITLNHPPSPSQVNRIFSALRSITVVPWEFFFGSPAKILNRK